MRRTKAEADETRARILEAAELLFFEKGVSDTTLDQIAKAAGVTRGAFYHHFEDKTALLREIYDAVPLPYEHLSRIECDPDGLDPFGAIAQVITHAIRTFAADARQQRVYVILTRVGLPDAVASQAQKHVADAYEQQRDELIEILSFAQAQGLMSENWTPQTAEAVLSHWLKGLYDDWILSERDFDLVTEGEDQTRRLIASFRRPVSPVA